MRRALALAAVLLAAPMHMAWAFEPGYATLSQLRAALDAHEISSEQLVRYYLDRIHRFDQHGPHINAVLRLNPRALEQARAWDRRTASRPASVHAVALEGIPFMVKDNFDSAGIATTGGSAALRGSVPAANAFVLQRLLDQGAILLGKTNLSELAASYGRLGYSAVGGLTLNPYNTRRNVSGSSSGSAAAVAADFAPFALGTDSSGSVRAPASVTALVGIRPTVGLLSRTGIIPSALSFDTPGILTRTVADTAIVLDAMAAPDRRDAATQDQPSRPQGYLAALEHASPEGISLRGVRLGVVTNFRGGNEEVDAAEQAALATLVTHGAILDTLQLPEALEHLWESVLAPVSEAEFKPQFERYLRSLPMRPASASAPVTPRTLAQLIRLSEATSINPARLQSLREAEATELTDSSAYIRLVTLLMPGIRAQLQALLESHQLQALVFVTISCPASARFDVVDPTYACRSEDPYRASYVGSASGFPEITVPAGRVSANMPVGLSFLGAPYSESGLLRLAAAFESVSLPPVVPALR